MNQNIKLLKKNILLIYLSIISSLLLSIIVSNNSKHKILNNFYGIEVNILTKEKIDANIYYSYDNQFDEKRRLKNISPTKDKLVFNFPKNNRLYKNFRIDFDETSKVSTISIEQISFLFDDEVITIKNKEKIYELLFFNSNSIYINNNLKIEFLVKEKPYDPYLIFYPVIKAITYQPYQILVIIIPFIILFTYLLIKNRVKIKFSKLDLLVLLFIISIPLKNAWTTFCLLLLLICAIYNFFHTEANRNYKEISIFFSIFFLITLFLGRIESFKDLDKHLTLLMFGIISIGITLDKISSYYKYYVLFFLFLNLIVVTIGISYLIFFKEFYGESPFVYFSNLKIYNGNSRNWLYYNHATFLTFFGLIGLLFARELLNLKKIDKYIFQFYNTFLLIAILIMGVRMTLLIYIIFNLNFLFKGQIKYRIVYNSIIYFIISVSSFIWIELIDPTRANLWMISWKAIKEKPLFGYGLDKSNEILHNQLFISDTNFEGLNTFNHSHNQIITTIIEFGFIGLFLFIATIAFFIIRLKLFKSITFMLFCFGIAYISLTESIFQTSKPYFVICFVTFLLTQKQPHNKNH